MYTASHRSLMGRSAFMVVLILTGLVGIRNNFWPPAPPAIYEGARHHDRSDSAGAAIVVAGAWYHAAALGVGP